MSDDVAAAAIGTVLRRLRAADGSVQSSSSSSDALIAQGDVRSLALGDADARQHMSIDAKSLLALAVVPVCCFSFLLFSL